MVVGVSGWTRTPILSHEKSEPPHAEGKPLTPEGRVTYPEGSLTDHEGSLPNLEGRVPVPEGNPTYDEGKMPPPEGGMSIGVGERGGPSRKISPCGRSDIWRTKHRNCLFPSLPLGLQSRAVERCVIWGIPSLRARNDARKLLVQHCS